MKLLTISDQAYEFLTNQGVPAHKVLESYMTETDNKVSNEN